MGIFDEPSRQELPMPQLEDVRHATVKGLLAIVPGVGGAASELLGLLSSPIAQRRDDWFSDLARRLRDLESHVKGFHFEDLAKNDQVVSAIAYATHAALRTHQAEKLDALRNVVLNVASGNSLPEDLQLIFLNLVDTFTPKHLQVLSFFEHPDHAMREILRRQRDLTDLVVIELDNRGLLTDTRPYAARNRDTGDSLVISPWQLSSLGRQFLGFIKSPGGRNP
jgi:hypothetical protein